MITFVPVFSKDSNQFFILTADFACDDKEAAYQTGLGAMLVECVLLGMEFTGKAIEIDTENMPHVKANLSKIPVAIISGPLFEENDKEDAREMAYWEPVMQGLEAAVRVAKMQKRQEMLKTHNRWQRRWRTRLANRLRWLADVVELPAPPLPS